MAKQDEIAYLDRLPAHGVEHAARKPFSDPDCGKLLAGIAAVFALLPRLPARILDLGCGTGWTSRFFAQAGYDVVGVDIAPSMIAIAEDHRRKLELANLRFRTADYESLEFRDEFDAVVFFDSLHHAEDHALAMRRAYQALKPGGVCVLSEPGRGHHEAECSKHAVREYGVTEKDLPPDETIPLARRLGFRSFQVYPSVGPLHAGLYATQRTMLADPFRPPSRFGKWGHLLNRLLGRDRLKARYAAIADELFDRLKDDGLVVLQK